MRSRSTTTIVTFVLAICLLGPLVDMFDFWDRAPQTGTDTEYNLVIAGLCVGTLYTFARVALKVSEKLGSDGTRAIDGFLPTLALGSLNLIVTGLIPASPPLAALRI
jgi:hypothetical protein